MNIKQSIIFTIVLVTKYLIQQYIWRGNRLGFKFQDVINKDSICVTNSFSDKQN